MDKLQFVLGGAAWINLINTTYNSEKQTIDTLEDPSSTFQWLEDNDLLRQSDTLALNNEETLNSLIAELHSLRFLCKMILSNLEQQKELSLKTTEELRNVVQELNVRLTIAPDKFKIAPEGTTAKDHVLYSISSSIFHTLDSNSVKRIRKCEHEECRLYFIDTSKSGKRRWCSMELCGNRKKAAEFYARKKKK
ncbi:CGNR zinc finger domain-containing protein [Aureibacillus halotolerans]|uniref:Putative RNA-binding Zn ribbon-like protein n=1 Tax=Aureibacillus halotolerans TaxID=1508390 RepID=A0A4R6U1K4_9BACI|nr:CGNR zinc finger domain-containing protein [Aureibacillus halotolerans]TDQ39811.1 putative RNA-binding Zn ribbon-like protein [Aureibacillus halotolerans]